MALLLSAVAVVTVGCGGGGGGRDPILGANGATAIVVPLVPIVPVAPFIPPVGAVLPGACTAAGPLVTASDPADGNQSASTSTTGVANNGKSITATFNQPMNGATINANSFTLAPAGGAALVPASVNYDAASQVATLTTAAALVPATTYTAAIQGAITNSPGGTPIGCSYTWTFKTAVTPAAQSALAINLGRAASFGIASRAGLTSTGVTVVNGDIALHPTPTCTDSTGNAGASQTCLVKTYASPTGMTVTGSIFWAGDPFDNGATALNVTNDLNVAWKEGMNKVTTNGTVAADQLGGKTFLPGVYANANLGLAAGQLAVMDAGNDPNAIFIFKVGGVGGSGDFVDSGTLLLPSEIRLVNQAQAKNVWFVAGRDITLGSGTSWNGNILAGRTATVNNGSTVTGRVLAGAAGAGAVTLTGAASPSVTRISVPQ